jgi:hypothetical protein
MAPDHSIGMLKKAVVRLPTPNIQCESAYRRIAWVVDVVRRLRTIEALSFYETILGVGGDRPILHTIGMGHAIKYTSLGIRRPR